MRVTCPQCGYATDVHMASITRGRLKVRHQPPQSANDCPELARALQGGDVSPDAFNCPHLGEALSRAIDRL